MFGEKWPIKRQEKNRKFGGRVRKINSSVYRFLFYTPFCMELSNTMRYWKMDSFLFVFYSLGPWCLSMVCPTYNGLSLNNERILMHELRKDLLGNVQISCENGIKTRPSSSFFGSKPEWWIFVISSFCFRPKPHQTRRCWRTFALGQNLHHLRILKIYRVSIYGKNCNKIIRYAQLPTQ